MDTEDNQLNDDAVLAQILRHAKPTLTLTQLKGYVSDMMDENDMRKSLGRLWRSVQVFRCAAGNQVVYWTAVTAKAVASSGLSPEMPPGYEAPEITKISVGVKRSPLEPKAQFDLPSVIDSSFVPTNKEEKIAMNKMLSRGQLIPISQTAAQTMVPLQTGSPGGIRRGGITGKVATVMFKYRDVRLSIDAVTALCNGVSRVDVARVISQLSSRQNMAYFIRNKGETRFDATYTWNPEFRYPFVARYPDDGAEVPLRNVDKEAENDVELDHIPTSQLSEEETESEIARLIRTSMETKPESEPEVQTEEPKTEIDGKLIVTNPDNLIIELADGAEPKAESELTFRAVEKVQLFDVSLVKEPLHDNQRLPHDATLGPQGARGIQGCGNDGTVKSMHEGESDVVMLSERRAHKIAVADDDFLAGYFTSGEMSLRFDNSQLDLTQSQTNSLIDLLGPIYMARKAA